MVTTLEKSFVAYSRGNTFVFIAIFSKIVIHWYICVLIVFAMIRCLLTRPWN